ncbi:ATP-binding protein [Olleya sp. R77988]|uniref:tetratricopeptide repeat-containing sensor histidine kinase n=1 Tax=Olleya sp. R77988 TaxID=3093875 RepID=UPI0037C86CC4
MKLQCFFFILFVGSFCTAQNDSTYFYYDKSNPIINLENKINNETNSSSKNWLSLIYHSRSRKADSVSKYLRLLKPTTFSERQKAQLDYFNGYYNYLIENDSLSLMHFNNAFKAGEKHNDSLTVLYSLLGLSQTYDYNQNNHYNKDYLDLLNEYSVKYKNTNFQIFQKYLEGNYHLFREQNKAAVNSFQHILNYKLTKKDSTILSSVYNSLGVLYLEQLNKPDSALIYYKKSKTLFKAKPELDNPSNRSLNYSNIARCYELLNDLKNAEINYLKADSIELNESVLSNKSDNKDNLSRIYHKLNQNKKAYQYLTESITYKDSLNTEEQNAAVAKYKESFDNEKLRADNIEIDSKRKRNKVLFITSFGLLLLLGVISFLIRRSIKRQQLLAEKEGEIQKQKVATLLKDQEINSINAMIEGQEKERQRIANDLHDDLGSLMATVKLQFGMLKDQQSNNLFDKTSNLIDEAYTKIRSIAHAKNSGVIAKQGLLKAVNLMAKKISEASNIEIEVYDFGLESRLENSLEITLFRIIQELTTNVIKHAQANLITINLTNHGNTLNIMIEDNGVGFDTTKVVKTDGMGLHSIEKRVEHLEGEMVVESAKNQGTTIIIDIPL